jgi:uncharacterized protein
LRVVLDTNVLISAFIFPGGAPEAVYRLALEGHVELVSSPPLLAEFGRVLGQKFGWEASRAAQAVGQLARIGIVVEPSKTVRVIEADSDDDRVLEAAIEASAPIIVSGYRHLLGLREWRGIRVLAPAAFRAELE